MELIYWLLMLLNLIIGMILVTNKHYHINWFQGFFSILVPFVSLLLCSFKQYQILKVKDVNDLIQSFQLGDIYTRIVFLLYVALLFLAAMNVCSLYNSDYSSKNEKSL